MKKRMITAVSAFLICGLFAACGTSQPAQESASAARTETTAAAATAQSSAQKRVAKDGAEMQTTDKSMPTRIPDANGTKINMIFGEKAPTGNDAEENEAEAEGLNFEPGDNTDEEESFEFFPEGGDEA